MPAKYVFSERQLRKILKRVDRQRVIGLPKSGGGQVWPMVEYGIPYGDEEFMCGLLTCEFRGWVERFGDEVPVHNMQSAQEAYQSLFGLRRLGGRYWIGLSKSRIGRCLSRSSVSSYLGLVCRRRRAESPIS